MNFTEILVYSLKLNQIITEIAVRGDTVSNDEAMREIRAFMSKHEIESFLNAIEAGEYFNEDNNENEMEE